MSMQLTDLSLPTLQRHLKLVKRRYGPASSTVRVYEEAIRSKRKRHLSVPTHGTASTSEFDPSPRTDP